MRTEAVTHHILCPPGSWQLDPRRSTVAFDVRHLKLLHLRGHFHDVSAAISSDDQGSASIAAAIEVASIDTGDSRRDARLRTDDFFDVDHHPLISFEGVSQPTDDSPEPIVNGTITIRGVRRPLELRVEASSPIEDGEHERRFRARGVLSRRDFGLDWDPAFAAGGLAIDDRVGLRLDVTFRRA